FLTASPGVPVPSFFSRTRPPPFCTLFPYTTLFRSLGALEREVLARDPRLRCRRRSGVPRPVRSGEAHRPRALRRRMPPLGQDARSEEHTSELQSRFDLVCRLLLEKKKAHPHVVAPA